MQGIGFVLEIAQQVVDTLERTDMPYQMYGLILASLAEHNRILEPHSMFF